jgi:hypothetical protein
MILASFERLSFATFERSSFSLCSLSLSTAAALLDQYAVTYAPGLEAFAEACSQAGRTRAPSPRLLAVVDPAARHIVLGDDGKEKSIDLGWLEASRTFEGPALVRLFKSIDGGFPSVRMLEGEDASRPALLSALEALRPAHLHFSCHGAFQMGQPGGLGPFPGGL